MAKLYQSATLSIGEVRIDLPALAIVCTLQVLSSLFVKAYTCAFV